MERRLTRYLLQRLGLAALSVWGLATLVFFMIKAIPGDEAQSAAGITATPEQVEAVRERLGLDRPLLGQYLAYLGRLLHGDLGSSIFTFRPVTADLGTALPATVELVATALVLLVTLSIPIGVLAAAYERRKADAAIRLGAIAGGALPLFWLGLILQHVLGARWGLLPISGTHSLGVDVPRVTGLTTLDALLAGDLFAWWDAVQHLVLPAATLSVPFVAFAVRLVRSSMITALDADHVVMARAKGTPPWRVMTRHGLRTCIGPVVTLFGMQAGWMVGAAVLVEGVFGRPGVGAYLTEAVQQKDTFAVLGVVLFTGVTITLVNLLVDLLHLVSDPRVRADRFGASPLGAKA
ncbi:peptide/nickel transport system permease protein [Actinocorallia herbida]|uniref:Peptide/nickel transport system permease protein n=1 Tax=Actinocorallia herbida TaxID=58109 RepID=A0A3N1CVJ1_9ACTN|nr:ABC transporter permease [Actinocorallia herbida]ROO85254.1 peptide/nickel transport system permease protein [Actinocorallia herbida]